MHCFQSYFIKCVPETLKRLTYWYTYTFLGKHHVAHYVTISSSELNSDLAKIGQWAFKWKMSFNSVSQFKK